MNYASVFVSGVRLGLVNYIDILVALRLRALGVVSVLRHNVSSSLPLTFRLETFDCKVRSIVDKAFEWLCKRYFLPRQCVVFARIAKVVVREKGFVKVTVTFGL